MPRCENLERPGSLNDVPARAIRKPGLAIFVRKQKGVEPKPRLDLLQSDHGTTRTIEYRVAARGEFRAPILIGLLVRVEYIALAWNRRREHDEVAMPAKVVD